MLGSLEFATAVSGARLVLVLGHTSCGAIISCIDREAVKAYNLINLDILLKNINPAVEEVLKPKEERSSTNKNLVDRATVNNVFHTLEKIRKNSPSLAKLELEEKLLMVGGIYDIESGRVKWLKED